MNGTIMRDTYSYGSPASYGRLVCISHDRVGPAPENSSRLMAVSIAGSRIVVRPARTLLVYVDDATSWLMQIPFVSSESTFTYFGYGCFLGLFCSSSTVDIPAGH